MIYMVQGSQLWLQLLSSSQYVPVVYFDSFFLYPTIKQNTKENVNKKASRKSDRKQLVNEVIHIYIKVNNVFLV